MLVGHLQSLCTCSPFYTLSKAINALSAYKLLRGHVRIPLNTLRKGKVEIPNPMHVGVDHSGLRASDVKSVSG